MDRDTLVKQATKKGYIECKLGGVADLSYPQSKTRRGRVQENGNVSPTITTMGDVCKIESKYRIRKLTPKECWRLMGFSDEDFYAAKTGSRDVAKEILSQYPNDGKRQMDEAERISKMSNTQLYKQAGNSIVTDVLYYIFKELYTAMPYLFEDLKVGSYFSGIGAFEIGLDRLFSDINNENFTNSQEDAM